MFVCNSCGNESLKWAGQCSFCKEWGTLQEFHESKSKSSKSPAVGKDLVKMHESSFTGSEKMQTKSQELNQLLS